MNPARWLHTNRFLRDALEEAHADLAIEQFHVERLTFHLREANMRICFEFEEHIHKLEADNTRLEWENERWRQLYYEKFAPPMPGLDK
jgi:hypothetical protein